MLNTMEESDRLCNDEYCNIPVKVPVAVATDTDVRTGPATEWHQHMWLSE